MLFNSIHFLFFFPIVVICYFLLPFKYRWVFLLIASYYFYMAWKPGYVVLLVLSTGLDYFAGIMMSRQTEQSRRRKYLILSLAGNLGLLFFFKYFNFFNRTLINIGQYFSLSYQIPYSSFLLPIGISFYTFQTLSYSIDVYWGRLPAEKHFGKFALFVSFFPQLVAGPIERATNLLHQFNFKYDFDYKRVTDGLKIMVWGLFKKVVIADRLALIVNSVYNDPTAYSGPGYVVATVFFAFQIYCDFSGYSDIAIGAAQVLGIRLMDNFNRPYHSKNISEFWKRWHISLSTWFKDYLYISLGGNRVKISRWYFNLMIVFIVSGFWHGANWTFLVWGALHGFYFVFSLITKDIRLKITHVTRVDRYPRIHKVLQVSITFVLVNISWIFFRANNVSQAWHIITHLPNGWAAPMKSGELFSALAVNMPRTFLISILSILCLESIHLVQRHSQIRSMLSGKPAWLRWSLYYAVVAWIVLGGVFDNTPFIYFQF